ncbi:MAG: RNA polymerase factor sigma-54 [Legionellales bacterium]|nr:RNA polymerase factor sigma-54 [Legionellales bacterium]
MKPSLHLHLNPSIKLTPQLTLAIQLLQLSTIELQQEVQRQIDINPLLDEAFDDEASDVAWTETYPIQYRPFNEPFSGSDPLLSTSVGLQDHLRWQLELTPMSETDHAIAMVIIDAIDDDGFITCAPEALLDTLHNLKRRFDPAEINAIRHRIQQFEPIGCAVYTLAETLLVQLAQSPNESEPVRIAKEIISQHLDKLCKHDYQKLMSIVHINEDCLEQVLSMLKHLNPRPGRMFQQGSPEQVIPDVHVKKIGSQWHVELNQTTLPHLSINQTYAALLHHSVQPDRQYLRHQLNEARWFIKSIRNRQETLLKIARFIVDYQKEFLDFGEEAMKPLILNDVAHALNMHESTISRATTQKFISTPRGLFELKYFFSNHLMTELGEGCSSTAIRAFIKRLITSEDHCLPMSDHQIAKFMSNQGVHIARRTVTKYRETMCIATSSERKSFHNKACRPFDKMIGWT